MRDFFHNWQSSQTNIVNGQARKGQNRRLNRRINERIRTGHSLATLTKAEREYCCLVLHASEHAGQMTPNERDTYRKARKAYRACGRCLR